MIDLAVIMPVFNEEKYIKQAIDSIIDQTFGNWILFVFFR